MRYVLGVLFILAGAVVGAYVGFWLLFIGGVTSIVEGIRADPAKDGLIAWGFIRVLSASGVGAAIFWSCAAVGGYCFVHESRPRRIGGSAKEVEARWRDVTK